MTARLRAWLALGLALGCGGGVAVEANEASLNEAPPSTNGRHGIDATVESADGGPNGVPVADGAVSIDRSTTTGSDVSLPPSSAPNNTLWDGTSTTSPNGGPPPDDGGSPFDASDDYSFFPANGPCGPSTCPGCCDYYGRCATYCGTGGVQCVACNPGYDCQNGACVRPQPNCGPSNCSPGCCIDSNTCSSGELPAACGRLGGETCQQCNTAAGEGCVTDAGCGPQPPPRCGASCTGCCYTMDYYYHPNGSAVCAIGNQDFACGANGSECSNCALFDAQCTPQGACRQ